MHPFIRQSIAAEHARDRQDSANCSRDAAIARGRRLRQRRERRASVTGRLLPARLRLRTS
jgi:hypothetical protein